MLSQILFIFKEICNQRKKRMQAKLFVPVLDGVVCALIIASGLVKYGVSTSKARRYNPQ
jgi:allantoin racemase